MIFGQATQVVPGTSIRAHISPARIHNPPPVELPAASTWSAPPSITQEVAPSLTGIKDLPYGTEEQYQDVLTLPLAGMFTSLVGRPDMIKGDE